MTAFDIPKEAKVKQPALLGEQGEIQRSRERLLVAINLLEVLGNSLRWQNCFADAELARSILEIIDEVAGDLERPPE